MKCPLCGKEYEGIKICPSCNLPLIDTETKQAVSLQPEKKHKKKNRMKENSDKNIQPKRKLRRKSRKRDRFLTFKLRQRKNRKRKMYMETVSEILTETFKNLQKKILPQIKLPFLSIHF